MSGFRRGFQDVLDAINSEMFGIMAGVMVVAGIGVLFLVGVFWAFDALKLL